MDKNEEVTFTNTAAQGDLYLRRVKVVPEGFVATKPTEGKHIVAHSETGHHHVVEAAPGVAYFTNPDDNMNAYLVVEEIIGAALKHCRAFDTHKTLRIPKGIFQLLRQREHTPLGWRRVED